MNTVGMSASRHNALTIELHSLNYGHLWRHNNTALSLRCGDNLVVRLTAAYQHYRQVLASDGMAEARTLRAFAHAALLVRRI